MSRIIDRITHKVPKEYQTNSWPNGIQPHQRPQSRFDVLKWKFFTNTTMYPENDHNTKLALHGDGIENLDISSIINNSLVYLSRIRKQHTSYFSFQYGYQRFDETRGMEYILNFMDSAGTELRLKTLLALYHIHYYNFLTT